MSARPATLLLCARCALPFAADLEETSYRKTAAPSCPRCRDNPMLGSLRHLNERRAAHRRESDGALRTVARWALPVVAIAVALVAYRWFSGTNRRAAERDQGRVERVRAVHEACASPLVLAGGHDDCVAHVNAFCQAQPSERLGLCAETTVRAYFGERALRGR